MSSDDDSWRVYVMEAQEVLRDVEACLLSMESSPCDASELNRLYRSLHTIKGNSALMGLSSVERLAHAAEDMAGLARDHGVTVNQPMVDLLLEVVDHLREAIEHSHRDRCDPQLTRGVALAEQVRAFIVDRHGAPAQVEASEPAAAFVLWSNAPTRSSEPSEAADAAAPRAESPAVAAQGESPEFFLTLCRELLPSLIDLIKAPDVGEAPQTAFDAIAELSAAAIRLGHLDLVDSMAVIDQLLRQGPAAGTTLAVQCERLRDVVCGIEDEARRRDPDSADCELRRLFGALGHSKAALQDGPGGTPVGAVEAPLEQPAKAPRIGRDRDAGGDLLRVDAAKISLVMDLAGEIALACSAVTHHPELEGLELEGYAAASHTLEALIRELQNEVSAMRLIPIEGVFQRMQRVVRDAARRTDKQVALTLVGEDTEIDKVMVDSLHDPLVHLIRNAIDHGIETPAERVAVGKDAAGRITLEALHHGGEVSVRVRDDGRGIDCSRVLAKARQRGLVAMDAQLSDAQIAELIFEPGFSTKEKVDEISGRGVGMDLIRTGVESLRGRLTLTNAPGRGTTVDLTLPLTLAFVDAMVIRERDRLFAVPIEKVSEVFKVDPGKIAHNSADNVTTLRVHDRTVPVLWLHRFYGEAGRDSDVLADRTVVVVQNSRGPLALPVDALLGNQPVMLKPLQGMLSGVRAAAGCGMLRSGDVALALDCEQLHA